MAFSRLATIGLKKLPDPMTKPGCACESRAVCADAVAPHSPTSPTIVATASCFLFIGVSPLVPRHRRESYVKYDCPLFPVIHCVDGQSDFPGSMRRTVPS